MSVHVSSRVWLECRQQGDRLLLMLALADFCNDEGICWPSQATLAHRVRCTERGVQKMIDCLISEGEITLLQKGGGRGKSAKYQLAEYVKGEQQTGFIKPIKGERQDIKGERAVPPNHQGTKNKPNSPNGECQLALTPSENFDPIEIGIFWNSFADKLPSVQDITKSRRAKLRTRMEEAFFRANWREAIRKLSESDFCRGANIRGWRANFDWLIENDRNIAKVLEGNYDNPKKSAGRRALTDDDY